MKLNIFGKERSTNEGRKFMTYFTRLTNKSTGETKTFSVKFRQDCDAPSLSDCPCVIDVPREKINLSEKPVYDKETGDVVFYTRDIWVSFWKMVGPFVDHSLDDWGDD